MISSDGWVSRNLNPLQLDSPFLALTNQPWKPLSPFPSDEDPTTPLYLTCHSSKQNPCEYWYFFIAITVLLSWFVRKVQLFTSFLVYSLWINRKLRNWKSVIFLLSLWKVRIKKRHQFVFLLKISQIFDDLSKIFTYWVYNNFSWFISDAYLVLTLLWITGPTMKDGSGICMKNPCRCRLTSLRVWFQNSLSVKRGRSFV